MRIFLSYSSDERAEALAVQSWLEKNGWENDVFVDVDPEHGLTGGEAWRTALRDAAGRCEAVVLLLSRAWLASKPCWNEFQLAEKYGKPCIPVRIDDAVAVKDLPREITNNYQIIEKAAAPPAEFEMRLKRALEAAGAGRRISPCRRDGGPIRGSRRSTSWMRRCCSGAMPTCWPRSTRCARSAPRAGSGCSRCSAPAGRANHR